MWHKILHALSVSWSPAVIAALVGGLIVAINNTVRDRSQRRREAEGALKRERGAAYGELLARSLALAGRVQSVRGMLPFRSGLDEGLSVPLRLRKPLDMLELHDWLGQDMGPLQDAWSKILIIGTQGAMDAADRLVSAAAELFGEVASGQISRQRLVRHVRGICWSRTGTSAYDQALVRLAEERIAFARLVRLELGYVPVKFALERAREERVAAGEGNT